MESKMSTYEICVVSKEYRWVEVEAEDEQSAVDKAWDNIENIMNRKAEDYDTEIYAERVEVAK